jgi:hypothetical protein
MVGENAAMCRQPDVYTIAVIETSCDDTPEGRSKKAARMVIEGCVDPKFGPEHEDALIHAKSPIAVGRLAMGITLGHRGQDVSLVVMARVATAVKALIPHLEDSAHPSTCTCGRCVAVLATKKAMEGWNQLIEKAKKNFSLAK